MMACANPKCDNEPMGNFTPDGYEWCDECYLRVLENMTGNHLSAGEPNG